MSFSDSETSSHGTEYKNFKHVSRDRLLHEMLGSSGSGDSRSSWKVLIMDKVTVKVMSSTCKMADITDQGVSLVEDLFRRRQPLPTMDAIYFIQPSKENVVMFLSDMSGREPLYRKAYVYFSSPIPKDLVARIKNDTSVIPRIGALGEVIIMCFCLQYCVHHEIDIFTSLTESSYSFFFFFIFCTMQMNLEYFPIDSQGFVTDHERALEELFGESAQNSRRTDACLNVMATRIATVFASLKEFPFVRYRGPKGRDGSTTNFRELVPEKLATAIWNNITMYRSSIPNFPQKETCELLILDRSVDQIAPVIHEWTYDAMCHDLLDMDGNKYVHEVPSKSGGPPEKKEVLLEDQDPVWLELRHTHIADASERLHDRFTNFVSKNKAAQMEQRDGGELSTRDLQKMVQALPQYNEQKERLSIHVEIAGELNKVIREMGLRELGQLEQDLVFGDAGTKEIIHFLRTKQDTAGENKLRLMMIYASVYPEKFEGDKAAKLMQLAKLSPEDMKAVKNMRMLEGSEKRKASSGSFSLKFDSQKKGKAARQDRTGEEETWQLFRFYPVIEELVEKMCKGDLPKDDYQCMNSPQPATREVNGSSVRNAPPKTAESTNPRSVRSRRTPNWARSRTSDDGYSSDSNLRSFSTDFKNMGQRIFVFIIGGATRSELRVCHKLTSKLRREVVLGTTSLDDPPQYITKLKLLSEKELSVDSLRI
ncbi:protein transport Sec1a isoform X1 [Nicotiana tomentosiformis]|uniref:protein transport Sec1a isoform X1 n=1 Tax=Nicotiana tomentosiformis TaxID=4098 RepID=UPI000878D185|nr:protein transport Sec1a isoform X1 [Nicotiana tomentosiformis]XP_018629070.1 protein transport Sec1a isoform X1 [Nicotiana tomentosiformis]